MIKYKDKWCQEAYDKGVKEGRDFEKGQLTKAKEIIIAYKNICNNAPFLAEEEVELKDKAEQFLNSEVEK